MAGLAGAESPPPEDVRALIASYRDDAYRLARHLVRSQAEAEDLTQTAILNVLRRADHINDVTFVRAYLLTTVRNLWRNQLRARGSRRFVGADAAEQIPSLDDAPEDQVLTAFDAALAQHALETLSVTSREILRLRYLDGLGFPELAARLAISPVAARQRAHRAREELIGACMDQVAAAGAGACQPIRRRLGRYHRGLLGRKLRAQVVTHLDGCAACESCYEQLVDLYGHRTSGSSRTERGG
jgi:RNA polymerase sigma-70 factor (ECF subfamily)